jgi:hypothetical protein
LVITQLPNYVITQLPITNHKFFFISSHLVDTTKEWIQMSKVQDTWTKASATLGAFSPFYQEGMFRLVRDHNAPNNWFTLTQVRSSEPNPYQVADMQAENPYTSPDRQRERLAALVEAGVLDEVEDGRYCLNERGRAIADGF